MDEIPSSHPQIRTLFDPELPNYPMLFAALDGRVETTIVVDDPEAPAMALARNPDGLTFISREVSTAFLRGALRRLQSHGPVVSIVSQPLEMFPKPDIQIPRYEFKDHDPEDPGFLRWLNAIPEGLRIVPMDLDLMKSCEWRDLITMVYGTVEKFLASAYGYCLVNGSRVLSEAYGAFTGAGGTEIGIVTMEDLRRRGYGSMASAALICEIRARGYKPYWSCDQSNEASASLARRLGFKMEREYMLYGYRPLVVPMGR